MKYIYTCILFIIGRSHSTIFNRTTPLYGDLNLSTYMQSFFDNDTKYHSDTESIVNLEKLIDLALDSNLNPESDELLEKIENFSQPSSTAPMASMFFNYNGTNTTLLHHAFENGKPKLVIQCIKSIQQYNPQIKGKDFDLIASPNFKFPLLYTIEKDGPLKNNVEITKLLLQMHTSQILSTKSSGYMMSALQYAIHKISPLDIIELFLNISEMPAGFDPDYLLDGPLATSSPIGLAITSQRSLDETDKLVQLLINNGADINELIFHQGIGASTVLADFCRAINIFIPEVKFQEYVTDRVKLLIKYQADINIKDSQGYLPLDNARDTGKDYLIPLLTPIPKNQNQNITEEEFDHIIKPALNQGVPESNQIIRMVKKILKRVPALAAETITFEKEKDTFYLSHWLIIAQS